VEAANGLTAKHRVRLRTLCDNAPAPKMPPRSEVAIRDRKRMDG